MKTRLAAFTAALNAYDLDAVKAMFAQDAVYVSPGVGGKLEGRAAIMAAFRRYFALHTDQVNEDFDVVEVDEHSLQSKWRLRSKYSTRQGGQVIIFNGDGLIRRIVVSDES